MNLTAAGSGFLIPWFIYLGLLGLHLVLPAREARGYVQDPKSGRPYTYRLNGLRVLLVAAGLWYGAGRLGWLPWDGLWIHRWWSLAGAITLGLIFSAALVFSVPPTGRGVLADFYLGRQLNRQFFGGLVDTKMLLYLSGGVMLELNLLSFAAHHVLAFADDVSIGVLVHVALFSWFVVDYFFFEHVHLYTYDLFAERLGFKLGWGCLTFYPYFYAAGLWSVADRPNPDVPAWLLLVSVVLFFGGWALSRGANLQKYLYKTDPNRAFLGLIPPTELVDGERRLLISGFWGHACPDSGCLKTMRDRSLTGGIDEAIGMGDHRAG